MKSLLLTLSLILTALPSQARTDMDLSNVAIIALLYAPIQLSIHENLHALSIKSYGHDIAVYKPYPSVTEGNFYFGYIQYVGEDIERGSKVIAMAPYFYNAGAFTTGSLLLNKYKGLTKDTLFTTLMLCPLIDTTFNYLGSFRRRTDFSDVGLRVKVITSSLLTLAWTKLIYTLVK